MATDAQIEALKTLAASLVKQLKLSPGDVWSFFVIRRGVFHLGNEGWSVTDPLIESTARAEIATVKTFITEEFGTGAGSLAKRTPPHLDLADACRARTDTTAAAAKPLVTQALKDRKDIALKILVRALACHFDLWNQGAIRKDATREILDRRLRLVERMTHNVNGGSASATWTVMGPQSWKDGNRTRIFEYPYINQPLVGQLLKAIQKSGVSVPTKEGTREEVFGQPDPPGTPQWDWLKVMWPPPPANRVRELLWDRAPPFQETPTADDPPPRPQGKPALVNARMPTDTLRRTWKVALKDSHGLRFFGGGPGQPTLADAIDELFGNTDTAMAKKTEYWERAWLYCDHVIAALHIEALLFARRRRSGKAAADAEVNGLATRNPAANLAPNQQVVHNKYVWLDSIPLEAFDPGGSTGLLDGRSGNEYFTTLRKLPSDFTINNDLEIGDQVMFFNNGIYDLLTAGALRLENATVVDLATNPDGSLNAGKLRFEGHGMSDNLAGYTNTFRDTINTELDEARALIAKAPQTATRVRLLTGHLAIRWAPYTQGLSPGSTRGPWWLVYPLKTPEKSNWLPLAKTVSTAVLKLPGTFGVDSSGAKPVVRTASRPAALGGTPKAEPIETAAGFASFTASHPDLVESENVLFPLMVPSGVGTENSTLPLWGHYLQRRYAKAGTTATLEPYKVDSEVIPGLFDEEGKIWSTFPKVRP